MKFDFRVDFTNGGYVEGRDFLLDLDGSTVEDERLKEMIVSALNLLRAGPVTIHRKDVVRRGAHQDG
ncbi:MAG: cyclase [Alphaproteobacteria bacterium]